MYRNITLGHQSPAFPTLQFQFLPQPKIMHTDMETQLTLKDKDDILL